MRIPAGPRRGRLDRRGPNLGLAHAPSAASGAHPAPVRPVRFSQGGRPEMSERGERASGASVTLLDVARAAGVSLATASRALNGSTRRVRPGLQERVLAAADELHYSANAQAQAMARGRTNIVGLVLSDVADPYFSSIAAGAIRAAEGQQLVVTMACTFGREERELDYLATLRGQRARAVIIVGSRVQDRGLLDRLGAEVRAFEQAGGRGGVVSPRQNPG